MDLLLPRHSDVAGGIQGLDAGEGPRWQLDSAACPRACPGATGRAERAANLARRLAWGLAAVLALVAGLAVLATGVRTAGLRSGTRPNDRHGHILDGAAAPTGSPIALPAIDCWHTLPTRYGVVSASL